MPTRSTVLAPLLFLAACGAHHALAPIANLGGVTGPLCVPAAWLPKEDDGARIAVDALAGGPALCRSAYGTATQCFALDLAHGALGAAVPEDDASWARSTEVARAPGTDPDAELAKETAIDGFPIPAGATMFTRATDGSWAAAIGDKIYVLEKGAAAPSHTLELLVDDEATSIGNSPAEALIRGDRLYVRSTDAGPYEYTTAFGRDGRRIGKVPIGDFGGSFDAIDGQRIGGGSWALEDLTILDAHGAATTIKRAHAKARCTGDELQNASVGDTSELTSDCAKDYRALLAPYVDVDVAAVAAGFIAVLHTGELGELVILSPTDLSIVAARPLAICK
jgi:hypothetical protein